LTANRPCAAGADLTDVTELTPTVPRRIFAPARHIEAAPGAVASAGPRDHHPVRAVGQECDRGRSHVPRPITYGALVQLVGRDVQRPAERCCSTARLMEASALSSERRVLSTTIFRSIAPLTPVRPSCCELFSVNKKTPSASPRPSP